MIFDRKLGQLSSVCLESSLAHKTLEYSSITANKCKLQSIKWAGSRGGGSFTKIFLASNMLCGVGQVWSDVVELHLI